jgi:hypothetical protein
MKDFIPYCEALELKQLGFDEPCFGYHLDNKFQFFADVRSCNTNSEFKFYPTAPTFSQCFRWFREQQEWPIDSWIEPYLSEQPKQYEGFYWRRGEKVSVGVFSTHDEAELNLLRKLIEIVKNKQK